jgi:hypothetical protein
VRHQIVEDAAALADVHVCRVRKVLVRVGLDPVAAEDGHHAIDGFGTRLEDQRVHDGEDRRIGADAEREHADRHPGEAGRSAKQAKAVTEILKQHAGPRIQTVTRTGRPVFTIRPSDFRLHTS